MNDLSTTIGALETRTPILAANMYLLGDNDLEATMSTSMGPGTTNAAICFIPTGSVRCPR